MEQLYNVTDAFTMVHPLTLVKGKNANVWDDKDRCYIDFVGGIGVLNLGHCHPHIVSAIVTQAQALISDSDSCNAASSATHWHANSCHCHHAELASPRQPHQYGADNF